eukprot:CAMPEP_0196661298 /NCGR_PEP_ID=MMETSP1086-20130531/43627_1 /TAXON_ID=77921 /ORGANISM="Cyanoptyche  gloeocystis , Strain SAG4.97" /LENGTH=96 /DNA_ID=CAMNT_0041996127 /DNA_START=224 /DNA_END=514 /DNA_ORIENTATION=-
MSVPGASTRVVKAIGLMSRHASRVCGIEVALHLCPDFDGEVRCCEGVCDVGEVLARSAHGAGLEKAMSVVTFEDSATGSYSVMSSESCLTSSLLAW